MTSEYELGCATCGGSLTRREVAGEALGLSAVGSVEVAECPDCGGRYFPETTLERLGGRAPRGPTDGGSAGRTTEDGRAGRATEDGGPGRPTEDRGPN